MKDSEQIYVATLEVGTCGRTKSNWFAKLKVHLVGRKALWGVLFSKSASIQKCQKDCLPSFQQESFEINFCQTCNISYPPAISYSSMKIAGSQLESQFQKAFIIQKSIHYLRLFSFALRWQAAKGKKNWNACLLCHSSIIWNWLCPDTRLYVVLPIISTVWAE